MADQSDSAEPVLRHTKHQRQDQVGTKFVKQTEELEKKVRGKKGDQKDKDKKKPAGGFDSTPIPHAPPGYTLKFTFHRAVNLPFADINTLSSDPYIIAVLKTALPKRNKQDPDLVIRTPTIHRNVNPEWNAEWIVANVPASGFFLKCRLYDEDPSDHDDRLGNVHVEVNGISEQWPGMKEQHFDIKKRMGSKRAYFIRGCAAAFSRNVKMSGEVIISVENLGKTPGNDGGAAYTVGPLYWSRHFSPLIGRLTGVKDGDEDTDQDGKKKAQKYNFQAIQMQLAGPVPAPLYHRYVEFRPFVAGMFTSHSLRGRILNRALHHQHARIYNYDRSTLYGIFQNPTVDMTKQFLEFVHHDLGGRVFTYIITLDGQWRFTETGKEFGIDLLSKHTMHSNVSIYIAFSGEFFIRRLKHPHHMDKQIASEGEPDPASLEPPSAEPTNAQKKEHPGQNEPNKDPHNYELIIDNDSGTYRPNAKYLHTLRDFIASNLPGLRVVTLDCQADEEKMNKLKGEQRDRKKKGAQVTYQQNHSESSISSSDEESLNRRADASDADGVPVGGMAARKAKLTAQKDDLKGNVDGVKSLAHAALNDVQAKDTFGREDGGIGGPDAPIVDSKDNQHSVREAQEPITNAEMDRGITRSASQVPDHKERKEANEKLMAQARREHRQEQQQQQQQQPEESNFNEKSGLGDGNLRYPDESSQPDENHASEGNASNEKSHPTESNHTSYYSTATATN